MRTLKVSLFAAAILAGSVSLAACEGKDIEEAEKLFLGECNAASASWKPCYESAMQKLETYRRLSDEREKIDMLTAACLNRSLPRYADALEDELRAATGKRPTGLRSRCRDQARQIVTQ